MQVCSKSYHSVSFPRLGVGGLRHALLIKAVKKSISRLILYRSDFATISACSGSDQASAVGCKDVVKVPWFLFLYSRWVKLKAAAQVTLLAWCYLLTLNTMFSPSASRLSP